MPDDTPTETELRRRLQETEAALQEALEERNRLWAELQGERATERELAEVRKSLALLEASPSWRVTAPLRSAKGKLGRGRHLARQAKKKLREDGA